MPPARVVPFDGVSSDRMAELQREIEGSEQPENVPAKEMVALHDPEANKSLVIMFFDNEDDYRRGDETLSAMPASHPRPANVRDEIPSRVPHERLALEGTSGGSHLATARR